METLPCSPVCIEFQRDASAPPADCAEVVSNFLLKCLRLGCGREVEVTANPGEDPKFASKEVLCTVGRVFFFILAVFLFPLTLAGLALAACSGSRGEMLEKFSLSNPPPPSALSEDKVRELCQNTDNMKAFLELTDPAQTQGHPKQRKDWVIWMVREGFIDFAKEFFSLSLTPPVTNDSDRCACLAEAIKRGESGPDSLFTFLLGQIWNPSKTDLAPAFKVALSEETFVLPFLVPLVNQAKTLPVFYERFHGPASFLFEDFINPLINDVLANVNYGKEWIDLHKRLKNLVMRIWETGKVPDANNNTPPPKVKEQKEDKGGGRSVQKNVSSNSTSSTPLDPYKNAFTSSNPHNDLPYLKQAAKEGRKDIFQQFFSKYSSFEFDGLHCSPDMIAETFKTAFICSQFDLIKAVFSMVLKPCAAGEERLLDFQIAYVRAVIQTALEQEKYRRGLDIFHFAIQRNPQINHPSLQQCVAKLELQPSILYEDLRQAILQNKIENFKKTLQKLWRCGDIQEHFDSNRVQKIALEAARLGLYDFVETFCTNGFIEDFKLFVKEALLHAKEGTHHFEIVEFLFKKHRELSEEEVQSLSAQIASNPLSTQFLQSHLKGLKSRERVYDFEDDNPNSGSSSSSTVNPLLIEKVTKIFNELENSSQSAPAPQQGIPPTSSSSSTVDPLLESAHQFNKLEQDLQNQKTSQQKHQEDLERAAKHAAQYPEYLIDLAKADPEGVYRCLCGFIESGNLAAIQACVVEQMAQNRNQTLSELKGELLIQAIEHGKPDIVDHLYETSMDHEWFFGWVNTYESAPAESVQKKDVTACGRAIYKKLPGDSPLLETMKRFAPAPAIAS